MSEVATTDAGDVTELVSAVLATPEAPARGEKGRIVRELLEANPNMTAQEIIDAAAAQGITVSTATVHMQKQKMELTTPRNKASQVDALEGIKAVIAFINKIGNREKALAMVTSVNDLFKQVGDKEKIMETIAQFDAIVALNISK